MSTCISRGGEFGEHLMPESDGEDAFTCRRCYVFDEHAAMVALGKAEARAERSEAELAEARRTLRRLLDCTPDLRDQVRAHAETHDHSVAAGACLDCDWTVSPAVVDSDSMPVPPTDA